MSPTPASCPTCGTPITRELSSAVTTVCPQCNSVLGQGEGKLVSLGKVARLVKTDSPLYLWLTGSYRDAPFKLTGHVRLGHEGGGTWDEWYLAFGDGRWGWLAQAQGQFYLTFEMPPEGMEWPSFEALRLNEAVAAMPGLAALTVVEKGEAQVLAAEGEIPYLLKPGRSYPYADLSGPGGAFATLDYSETPPLLFVGREITLDELGIAELTPEVVEAGPAVADQSPAAEVEPLSCPSCRHPLELRTPDQTERITCPECGTLSDVRQGQALGTMPTDAVQPRIPLGSVGKFLAGDLTVIGFLQRTTEVDGVYYHWHEYLLHHPQVGFRWLVCSDNHWNFCTPVPAGDVSGGGHAVMFRGQRYQLFQQGLAYITYLNGEFYWNVTAGEPAYTQDYVCPPKMLTREVSTPDTSKGEVNWTLGTYLTPGEVEQAFGIRGLPRPATVGPNQPFRHTKVYTYWALFTAAAILLALVLFSTIQPEKVYENRFTIERPEGPDKNQVIVTQPFELKERRNIHIQARADIDNTWLHLTGHLIHDETLVVQPFEIPLEFYHGTDAVDGAWTEGDREGGVYLSSLPAGQYTLRLEVEGERLARQPGNPHFGGPAPVFGVPAPARATSFDLRIEQGVARWWQLLAALAALAIIPVIVFIYQRVFEQRRWQNSNVRA